VVWLLLVFALAFGGLPAGFAVDPGARFPLEVIPLAMLVGGIALFGIGRLAARGEAAFLLRFLQDELEAQEQAA
jgi:hypothetical protein